MRYHVRHRTNYVYASPADACHNVLRLTPRSFALQECHEHTLRIAPEPASVHTFLDYFGNQVRSFAIYEPLGELTIESVSHVDVDRPVTDEPPASEPWEATVSAIRTVRDATTIDASQYAFDSRFVRCSARLRQLALRCFLPDRPVLESTLALSKLIYREFTFDSTATTIDTSIDDVLDKRRGVCQDFAHLQLGCLRSLGLACRYMSGYLCTEPAPGQPRLEGADASHAWISVYSTRHGWVEFDPTNGCLVGERHIVIGWGRDFHDISPIKGVVLGGGSAKLYVAVDVIPFEAAPAMPVSGE